MDATVYDIVTIQHMQVSAYTIPTDGPEADGTLQWDSTTLVLVEIEAGGKTGIGYTYAHETTQYFIDKALRQLVVGQNALNNTAITQKLVHHIRNNGTCGIAMMAVSAVDSALWDLKAKLLNLPLCVLLGKVKEEVLIYGSGGFTSYSKKQLQEQLGTWVEEGIHCVKMKVGAHPEKDEERVKVARKAIGHKAQLFVDANGAYTLKQAVKKAAQFAAQEVVWFEEPVTSDNLKGLRFIRKQAPPAMNITAGEYGYNLPYFQEMLRAGAVDILQADATRCGGISGFLQTGALCEAFQLPFSSHCAPALHLHAALSLPSFFIAEYFYDHARIEHMLLDGIPLPLDGVLKPDLSRPGFGFDFKHQDAEKYKI